MNTIWSTYVQKIGTLYDTRSLRFSDIYKDKYLKAFKIEDRSNLKLLEIGCGPGALAESLRRWYPNISIYAIDRDSNFINYASKKSSSIYFSEGDATRLKFDNNDYYFILCLYLSQSLILKGLKFYKNIFLPLFSASVSYVGTEVVRLKVCYFLQQLFTFQPLKCYPFR